MQDGGSLDHEGVGEWSLFESLCDLCCLWTPLLQGKTPVLLEQGQKKCAETCHSVCAETATVCVQSPPLSVCRARKGSRVPVPFEKILGEADHAFPLCQASREVRVIRILPASLDQLLSDAQLPWLLFILLP